MEPAPGMILSGFVVRSTLPDVWEQGALLYGLFATVEGAESWQKQMNIPTVIEPVYAPVYNRG